MTIKQTVYIALSLLIALGFSCNDEKPNIPTLTENGIIIQKTPVWVKLTCTEKKQSGCYVSPILYDDKVVYSTTLGLNDGDWSFMALNVNTGEQQWRWNTIRRDFWSTERNDDVYQNIFINLDTDFNRTVTLFGIDLAKGKTLWSHVLNAKSLSDNAVVFKDYFYFHFYAQTNGNHGYTSRPIIFRGNPTTGEYEQYLIPPIDSIRLDKYHHDLGSVRGITFFTGSNGHDYMILPYSVNQNEDVESDHLYTWGNWYIALYDMTTGAYIYKDALIVSGSVQSFNPLGVEIYDERIMLFDLKKRLYGVDLYTGKVLWEQHRPGFNGGAFSYVLESGVLVACPRVGAYPYAFGFDPEIGTQLWSTPTGGGASSKPTKYHGIVYWQDSGNAKLYALEASTGKILWKLKDPDPEWRSWWTGNRIAILPPKQEGGKAKLYATTYMRAYCFETER